MTVAGAGPALCGERGVSLRKCRGFINGLGQAGSRRLLALGFCFVRSSRERCSSQQHGGSRALLCGSGDMWHRWGPGCCLDAKLP